MNKKGSVSQQRNWKRYYAKRKNKLFKICMQIRRQIERANLFERYPFEGSDYSEGQRLAALMFKYESKLSYIEAEDFLRKHPRERNALGIGKLPDSNTIWRANTLLKKRKREELFDTFFSEKKESDVAIDSSGFSQNRFARWMKDKLKKAKDFVKTHVLAQSARKKLVAAFSFTNGRTHDAKRGKCLVRKGRRRVALRKVQGDKGYLGRELAQKIEDAGGIPFLKPKSNTGCRSKGFPAFRRMMLAFKADEEAWLKECAPRVIIEGIFSWLKRTFGGALLSRIYEHQKAELTCKLFLYNINALLFF